MKNKSYVQTNRMSGAQRMTCIEEVNLAGKWGKIKTKLCEIGIALSLSAFWFLIGFIAGRM